MNPPQNNFAEKHSQWLRQFLVEFNDNRLLKQFLQFDGIAGIERSSCWTKSKRLQNSRTRILPKHSTPPELHALKQLSGIKEIRILAEVAVVNSRILELL